jgi:hypothetical protein
MKAVKGQYLPRNDFLKNAQLYRLAALLGIDIKTREDRAAAVK